VATPWFQLALRVALAAGFSIALAQISKLQHPIFLGNRCGHRHRFFIGQDSHRKLGRQRIVTKVVGAACGAVAAHAVTRRG
jgi:hypothetical protein